MKNVKKSLAALMLGLGLVVGGSSVATAQVDTGDEQVDQVVSGLVALNINDINVNVEDVITINDIIVTDVIDVTNVLNKNEIKILNDFIVTIDVDNVLNNLLQNADVLNNNQIVVGLLSDQDGITLITETVKRVKNEQIK